MALHGPTKDDFTVGRLQRSKSTEYSSEIHRYRMAWPWDLSGKSRTKNLCKRSTYSRSREPTVHLRSIISRWGRKLWRSVFPAKGSWAFRTSIFLLAKMPATLRLTD